MDKNRRVFIETISAQFDVSVGTVHTIIRKELKMQKICTKFVPRVLREDQKERCCHDSREMVELINTDPAVLDALVTYDESWNYCYDPETKRQISQWKHAGSPWQSKSTHKLLMIPFFWQHWHDLNALGSYWTYSQQVNKSQLHPCHGPRWASRQFLSFPIVQTLLPETFAYTLSSEAVVMRQLRRWKRLWRWSLTHSHKRTSMKLLERYNMCIAARGDYFEGDLCFMSVLSIKVPIRKSLKTYLRSLVCLCLWYSISKPQRILCVSFSRMVSSLCIYCLLVW